MCQELIEVELTAQIGADRYERTASRSNERNGHRSRVLSTKAGDVELAIPKLRKGSFFPSILEPRRRIDQALYAVVMEAYVHGVSTRAVDELVAALGVSSGISRSEVSRICAELDEVVGSFRERRLDHVGFPYVYLDATYLHVREHHQVTSKAVVIATGVAASGHREILGIDVGDSENEVFWREFVRKLRARGLEGVRWSSPTSTPGWCRPSSGASREPPTSAAGSTSPGTCWPRSPRATSRWCRPPSRRSLPRCPGRTCTPSGTRSAATLEGRFDKGAALMTAAKEEVLAFIAYPTEHWRQIWSTNPLERLNKELKRRCRVVGIFPNEASVIRLGGAVLLDVHDEWVSAERRYFSESSMAKLYRVVDNDDASVNELTPSD